MVVFADLLESLKSATKYQWTHFNFVVFKDVNSWCHSLWRKPFAKDEKYVKFMLN